MQPISVLGFQFKIFSLLALWKTIPNYLVHDQLFNDNHHDPSPRMKRYQPKSWMVPYSAPKMGNRHVSPHGGATRHVARQPRPPPRPPITTTMVWTLTWKGKWIMATPPILRHLNNQIRRREEVIKLNGPRQSLLSLWLNFLIFVVGAMKQNNTLWW